jgi:hypothetical protein
MLETLLIVHIACLVKVVHIHLPNKRTVVVVLEKTG